MAVRKDGDKYKVVKDGKTIRSGLSLSEARRLDRRGR